MIRLALILIGLLLNAYTHVNALGNILICFGLYGYFIQYFPYPKAKKDITYDK